MLSLFHRAPAARPLVSLHRQRGNVAPMLMLALAGGLIASAFALDVMRLDANASQLKRAADAAVLAVGRAALADPDRSDAELGQLAEHYVRSNQGLDQRLADEIAAGSITLTRSGSDTRTLFSVQVGVDTRGALSSEVLNTSDQHLTATSRAEVIREPLEVALMLPNSRAESGNNMVALRRLAHDFSEQLFEGTTRKDTWLALVPYAQAVNVFAADHPDRVRHWSDPATWRPAGAAHANRVAWFWQQGYRGLIDPLMPDRQMNLLCMGRGLLPGQNYHWQQPPGESFEIYYRFDLPENGTRGAYPDAPRIPRDDDNRAMIADYGCPRAPVLPLSADLRAIDARLAQMQAHFVINLGIAMGWAGMTLAPEMGGVSGWGEPYRPLDFAADHHKAVVVLNSVLSSLDSDGYNYPEGEGSAVRTDGNQMQVQAGVMAERIASLCASFAARDIKLYYLGLDRPPALDPSNPIAGAAYQAYRQQVVPTLKSCTNGDFEEVRVGGFAAAEGRMSDYLSDIAADLQRRRSNVRLIE